MSKNLFKKFTPQGISVMTHCLWTCYCTVGYFDAIMVQYNLTSHNSIKTSPKWRTFSLRHAMRPVLLNDHASCVPYMHIWFLGPPPPQDVLCGKQCQKFCCIIFTTIMPQCYVKPRSHLAVLWSRPLPTCSFPTTADRNLSRKKTGPLPTSWRQFPSF